MTAENPTTIIIEVRREVDGSIMSSRHTFSVLEWESAKVSLADLAIERCINRLDAETKVRTANHD